MDQDSPTTPATPAMTPLPVPPATPTPRPGISNRALNIVLGVALVVAVAGIGFAAGRLTAPVPTLGRGNVPGGTVFVGPGASGRPDGVQGSGAFGATGGPTIEGTVESKTDTTLTIKTADGRTIQIALDGTTTYHAQTNATSSDLVTGGKVLVRLDFGTRTGDGNASTPKAGDVTVVP